MTRGANIVETARKAEALGYHCLSLADHFGNQASPMLALAAAAAVTTNLRLAPLVLANDFRHPVMLAKEAATLDLISGGRLELGIGAGWMESDYAESGIAMDPPGVRIERLAESLQIVRALLGPNRCQFAGTHYQVDMDGYPKPVQSCIPIFLGGGGRRMLTLAAQQADIVGINLNLRSGLLKDISANFAPAACDQKVAWVNQVNPNRELHILIGSLSVTNDKEAELQRVAQELETDPEILRDSPHVLVGSVSEMVDILLARRERWGLSYVTVREVIEQFAPVVAKLSGA
jgi:probable F420-dependent oxidoreductase